MFEKGDFLRYSRGGLRQGLLEHRVRSFDCKVPEHTIKVASQRGAAGERREREKLRGDIYSEKKTEVEWKKKKGETPLSASHYVRLNGILVGEGLKNVSRGKDSRIQEEKKREGRSLRGSGGGNGGYRGPEEGGVSPGILEKKKKKRKGKLKNKNDKSVSKPSLPNSLKTREGLAMEIYTAFSSGYGGRVKRKS